MKVRRKPPPKDVPAAPDKFVFLQLWLDLPFQKGFQVDSTFAPSVVAGDKHEAGLRIALNTAMRLQEFGERLDNRDCPFAPFGLGFADEPLPNRLSNPEGALAVVLPLKTAEFAPPQASECGGRHDGRCGIRQNGQHAEYFFD